MSAVEEGLWLHNRAYCIIGVDGAGKAEMMYLLLSNPRYLGRDMILRSRILQERSRHTCTSMFVSMKLNSWRVVEFVGQLVGVLPSTGAVAYLEVEVNV